MPDKSAEQRRERVAALAAEGLTGAQIAAELGISPATVSRDLTATNTQREVRRTVQTYADTIARCNADLARLDEDRAQLSPDDPRHEALDDREVKVRRQRDITADRRARLLGLYPNTRTKPDQDDGAEEQGKPGGIPESFWQRTEHLTREGGPVVRKFPEHLKKGWYRTERGTWRYDPEKAS